ncbi:competence type IV pilus minor pilin ComGD [Globicatella sp. HMSC072A10]|uniref:competence type IV pilus minor pilin ComGD n=1 Tax=Globicatella sp. HMSC072A10 TaxID=1739315 RepID=UPI00114CEF28|nr:competence type IV pilus minor pilin ComGD [Globicatella sp. HMSC072A10]
MCQLLVIVDNNRGFTLVEMLIHLIIISFLILLIIKIPHRQIANQIENRLFVDQLVAQLNYTQQKALFHNKRYTVTFDQSRQEVRFNDRNLQLPETLYFNQTFIFDYLANGRVNQFRTVTLYNDEGPRVKIVFQLGSGKFVVQPE